MHHFIQINTSKPPKLTFEKRLFHALHINRIHSPSIKEFKENWAMANAVRKFMKDDTRMEYVLDVAGGHGALGALFLLLVPRCHTAIVIDPAKCASGKRGVSDAWSRFWSNDTINSDTTKKTLRYRHECLRTGLREELKCILQQTKSTNVTVVACHACQHLTDETLQIASEFGVNVAVMPCCQKDHDGWWKGLANRLVNSSGDDNASLSIGALMDLLAAGKMMSWETGANAGVRYQVKMKLMDATISLQNRIILCKAVPRDANPSNRKQDRKKELAHERLTLAYKRAHQVPGENGPKDAVNKSLLVSTISDVGKANAETDWCIHSLLSGVCLGASLSFLIASQMRKGN